MRKGDELTKCKDNNLIHAQNGSFVNDKVVFLISFPISYYTMKEAKKCVPEKITNNDNVNNGISKI